MMMMLAALFLTVVGCGVPWTVVRQAAPSPLVGKTSFALNPIDFTGLRVGEKDEAGYLAEKDDDSKANWVGDKKGMNDEFAKACAAEASGMGIQVMPGGKAEFVIQPKVSWIEPGFYAYVAAKASNVQMTVVIQDASGNVVDEITMEHATGASMTNPAVGNRLRDDAEALGAYMARYLQSRVSPGS